MEGNNLSRIPPLGLPATCYRLLKVEKLPSGIVTPVLDSSNGEILSLKMLRLFVDESCYANAGNADGGEGRQRTRDSFEQTATEVASGLE